MCSIDDATVSATDRKGLRKLDRVDEIEDVKGAVEGRGAVHVPEDVAAAVPSGVSRRFLLHV